MSWSVCDNATEFLEKREDVLVSHESQNNLTWAAIERSKNSDSETANYTFLTFNEAQSPRAHAFVKHSEKHLVLGAMSNPQASLLVTFIESHELPLELIEGPREAALHFATAWAQAPGRSHEIEMDQGLYELTQVEMPDFAGGQMIPATEENREVLQDFFAGFCRDCFPNRPIKPEQVEARVQRFLSSKKAYLWQNRDKEVVSMAAVVRESPNTTSISIVYTPPNHRRQGHAAQIVAALSQARLDAGKTACNLHTDLSNSTSNSVYLRIGYEMILKSARIRLIKPDQDHT